MSRQLNFLTIPSLLEFDTEAAPSCFHYIIIFNSLFVDKTLELDIMICCIYYYLVLVQVLVVATIDFSSKYFSGRK